MTYDQQAEPGLLPVGARRVNVDLFESLMNTKLDIKLPCDGTEEGANV
jgi:hypothetical protein